MTKTKTNSEWPTSVFTSNLPLFCKHETQQHIEAGAGFRWRLQMKPEVVSVEGTVRLFVARRLPRLLALVGLLLYPGSGELRTQKLKSHLVRTQNLNVLPLKPEVGQYIAIHVTLTAMDFFLAYF